MLGSWLSALVAWLNPLRSLAWEQAAPAACRAKASLGWYAVCPLEDAADDELLFHVALLTAVHC